MSENVDVVCFVNDNDEYKRKQIKCNICNTGEIETEKMLYRGNSIY